jgi:hypothetical protein
MPTPEERVTTLEEIARKHGRSIELLIQLAGRSAQVQQRTVRAMESFTVRKKNRHEQSMSCRGAPRAPLACQFQQYHRLRHHAFFASDESHFFAGCGLDIDGGRIDLKDGC